MNVREQLISSLEVLGYPIGLQGSYEIDDIPESLITYRIANSTDKKSYDNKPTLVGYEIEVNFYSQKMSLINIVPEKISKKLLDAGFTRNGEGYDVGLDKDTGHYGWLMEYYFIVRKE